MQAEKQVIKIEQNWKQPRGKLINLLMYVGMCQAGGQSKIYCENVHMGAEKMESTGPQSEDESWTAAWRVCTLQQNIWGL